MPSSSGCEHQGVRVRKVGRQITPCVQTPREPRLVVEEGPARHACGVRRASRRVPFGCHPGVRRSPRVAEERGWEPGRGRTPIGGLRNRCTATELSGRCGSQRVNEMAMCWPKRSTALGSLTWMLASGHSSAGARASPTPRPPRGAQDTADRTGQGRPGRSRQAFLVRPPPA